MTKSLTKDQFTQIEANLTKMQDLNLQQNKTLEDLKRCYALAHLAGVHPDDLARVEHRIEYSSNMSLPLYRWRRNAFLVIHVYPTSDPSVNTAAKRLGAVPEIKIPLEDAPHCLWDPTDLEMYNKVKARKEQTNGNQ